MGISQLWTEFKEVKPTSLLDWSVQFYKAHNRCPVLAVDMSPFLYELLDGTKSCGHVNFHHQFMRRISAFLNCGITIVGVFDGENAKPKLRNEGKRKNQLYTRVFDFMRDCLRAFGLEYINAPGEAEAQCAYMQRQGLVDAVFTKDSDILCFGATSMLRYSDLDEDKTGIWRNVNAVSVDRSSQWRFIFIASIRGNDFDKGIDRFGYKLATDAADPKTGFVEEFKEVYTSRGSRNLELSKRTSFQERLTHELRTNESKYFPRKYSQIFIPPDFPDLTTVEIFAEPRVRPLIDLKAAWRTPNIDDLHRLWTKRSPIATPVSTKDKPKQNQKVKQTQTQLFSTMISGPWLVWHILNHKTERAWVSNLWEKRERKVTVVEISSAVSKVSKILQFTKRVEIPSVFLRGVELQGKINFTLTTREEHLAAIQGKQRDRELECNAEQPSELSKNQEDTISEIGTPPTSPPKLVASRKIVDTLRQTRIEFSSRPKTAKRNIEVVDLTSSPPQKRQNTNDLA